MSTKKIVITGSESFIGKTLIKQLQSKDYEIIGFDSILPQNPTYEFHQVDIRNSEIYDLIPKNTDILIHLAALSRDPDCKNKAIECFDKSIEIEPENWHTWEMKGLAHKMKGNLEEEEKYRSKARELKKVWLEKNPEKQSDR